LAGRGIDGVNLAVEVILEAPRGRAPLGNEVPALLDASDLGEREFGAVASAAGGAADRSEADQGELTNLGRSCLGPLIFFGDGKGVVARHATQSGEFGLFQSRLDHVNRN